jgi:DNA-directed RNA polymerase sigma subunit (sigma70/sigma32)
VAADGEPDDPEVLWRALLDAHVVASADGMRAMMQQVRDAVPITAEEEAGLAERIRAGRADAILSADAEAAERALRDAHLGLVVTLAKHYTGHGTAFLDLIEIGNVGLAQAIRAYNPAKGYRFSIYATWWIRHAFARAITA